VILLDTDLLENSAEDREITHFLYGRDATYRFKQEMILGIGGIECCKRCISKHHMNEVHSALLALELLHRYTYHKRDLRPGELKYDLPVVRSKCIFTTHTPVEAGQDTLTMQWLTGLPKSLSILVMNAIKLSIWLVNKASDYFLSF
jgi:starch phosphorylase